MKIFFLIQLCLILLACSLSAHAVRLKDMANIRGVRSNQLVGYGLVVGLMGTGDSKTEYTNKSVARMLDRLGMKVQEGNAASKNVAAVIITAELPAFARAGNRIDVTISALGDASSLKGGTLIQSPLRGADQQIYAVAQGPLLIGEGSNSHLTVGRVPNGAMIERDLGQEFSNRKMFRLTLHYPDFTTAARVAKTINRELAGKYASALDAATIDLIVPQSYEGKGVEMLSVIEALEINPDTVARVVINEKTGTVVMGGDVRILPIALAHGDLSIKIGDESNKASKSERFFHVNQGANIGEIVKGLNRLGVTPRDLIMILQNMKSAGVLQGELEIL